MTQFVFDSFALINSSWRLCFSSPELCDSDSHAVCVVFLLMPFRISSALKCFLWKWNFSFSTDSIGKRFFHSLTSTRSAFYTHSLWSFARLPRVEFKVFFFGKFGQNVIYVFCRRVRKIPFLSVDRRRSFASLIKQQQQWNMWKAKGHPKIR